MKTLTPWMAVFTAALVSGCTATTGQREFTGIKATSFTVSVACDEPTMGFGGTIVSDGHTEPFSGTGSATLQVSGHEVVCAFKKTHAPGRITLRITKGGELIGEATTDEAHGGVRAELLYIPNQRRASFTSFR